MESIILNDRKCLYCRTTENIESHHIFGGPNRKNSEKYGLKVWLCHEHHTGPQGVHFNKELMDQIHNIGQLMFEAKYSHEEFIRIFGKNYLEELKK